ncbi:hypothetical protein H310_12903 [Aphanomyces invadans]|uniref:Uncharacterized protein n=1 Tax=Aphanomyces invadans TaxID=157072 RepID=A0A024TFP8_9STRA|nr:hypothetical protein H310_12903 [Aphanomyces invadans]ETV92868.1 hypothetical protein H310_12903 [Aphanomyces invadans]|eukprot:XP_008878389.1 hypothetical protein H310_12903 [Aphanomyces invadans]
MTLPFTIAPRLGALPTIAPPTSTDFFTHDEHYVPTLGSVLSTINALLPLNSSIKIPRRATSTHDHDVLSEAFDMDTDTEHAIFADMLERHELKESRSNLPVVAQICHGKRSCMNSILANKISHSSCEKASRQTRGLIVTNSLAIFFPLWVLSKVDMWRLERRVCCLFPTRV